MKTPAERRRIAVVGGGIGGLAAAWLLGRDGHQTSYLDASQRPGGFLRSTWREGYLCESGPSAVRLRGPVLRSLIEGAGLHGELLHASGVARRRLVWAQGGLQPVPSSPLGLLRSPLLSARERFRLLLEPLVPARRGDADETVMEFGRRRLGEGAARALLAPAVAGTYGGDAAAMSAASALPELVAMERRHGSLTRGLLARRSAAAPLISFPGGMETLPRALAAAVESARVRSDAAALEPTGTGWRVHLAAGPALDVDRVLLSAPPLRSAALLEAFAPEAGQLLRGLRFAPVTLVHLGFASRDPGIDLDAFGFLVPPGPQQELLACQYESSLLPGRAPAGGFLIRAILGGDFLDLDDGALAARALDGLRRHAGLRRAPDLVHVERHPRALPWYQPGHGARLAALGRALDAFPGLALACHGLEGVGIRSAVEQAARAVLRLTA